MTPLPTHLLVATLALLVAACAASSSADPTNTKNSTSAGTDPTSTETEPASTEVDTTTSEGGGAGAGAEPESTASSGSGTPTDGEAPSVAACVGDNQPQTRDGNPDCHSPFYHTTERAISDVLGCDCEPCDDSETCADGAQYFCAGTWYSKEVGSCDVPNACVEIWLRTFQSDMIDDCERLAGGFIIGDDPDAPVPCRIELTFTNYLQESRGAAGQRDGEYRCDGMNIVGSFGPSEIQGRYDVASNVLTWDGMELHEIENDLPR